ncbi:MAG: SAM-dependent methyltransferase, partial [Flavobacteriales bacterium]|nr:SAM-dependent methyltransferase [Flavobacteriales bacterium]
MASKGTLFLIPTTLGDNPVANVIPAPTVEIVNAINHYVAEDIRTARRYLSKLGVKSPIQTLEFYQLNKRTTQEEIPELLAPALNGYNLGLLSEAG